MGVGGQCHALTALLLWKTQYPLYWRLGGPQGWSHVSLKSSLIYSLIHLDHQRFLFPFFYAVILGYYFWIISDNQVFPSIHICVYNAFLIYYMSRNMAGCGDAKPKFSFLANIYTSSCSHLVATWSVVCPYVAVSLYVYRLVYWKTVFNRTIWQWRFKPGTKENHEEKYEANVRFWERSLFYVLGWPLVTVAWLVVKAYLTRGDTCDGDAMHADSDLVKIGQSPSHRRLSSSYFLACYLLTVMWAICSILHSFISSFQLAPFECCKPTTISQLSWWSTSAVLTTNIHLCSSSSVINLLCIWGILI